MTSPNQDKNRLSELREKYGKRDGSTEYAEPEPDEYWAPKIRSFVRIRRFWHCLYGAWWVVVLRHYYWGMACACPGTCLTVGFCPLVTRWHWVERYARRNERV